MYINGFPLSINAISDAIMFADDTNFLIRNRNFKEFKNALNLFIPHIAEWFHASQLILNVDKTNIVKFIPTNMSCNP
jgi:hypothetical protein